MTTWEMTSVFGDNRLTFSLAGAKVLIQLNDGEPMPFHLADLAAATGVMRREQDPDYKDWPSMMVVPPINFEEMEVMVLSFLKEAASKEARSANSFRKIYGLDGLGSAENANKVDNNQE